MQRITKRNEDGGVSIDGMNLALTKLAEYEDTGLDPKEVTIYKYCYDKLADLPDCGDCAKQLTCEYFAKIGEAPRVNCFAWEGKDGLTNN